MISLCRGIAMQQCNATNILRCKYWLLSHLDLLDIALQHKCNLHVHFTMYKVHRNLQYCAECTENTTLQYTMYYKVQYTMYSDIQVKLFCVSAIFTALCMVPFLGLLHQLKDPKTGKL